MFFFFFLKRRKESLENDFHNKKKTLLHYEQTNLWIDTSYRHIPVISPVCKIIKPKTKKEFRAYSENILVTFQTEKGDFKPGQKKRYKRAQTLLPGLIRCFGTETLCVLFVNVCVCVCLQKAHRQLGPSCSMTKIASKLNMFNTWGCVSVFYMCSLFLSV